MKNSAMIQRTSLIHILLVLMVGFVVYSNTFLVPFVWDDERLMITNPFVRDMNYPVDGLKNNDELYKLTKMRYVGMLTFALNYKIHGADVVGYHVVNLTVHLLNAVLVYLLVVLTFKTPFLERTSLAKDAGRLAVCTALFFVAHPVQTEAVTYVFQRLASFATFCYLAAVVLYAKAGLLQRDQEYSLRAAGQSGVSRQSIGAGLCYAGSLSAAVAGMFIKEILFTLPLVILLYEFSFFERRPGRRIARLAPFGLTLMIIPIHYLFGLQRTFVTATREFDSISYGRLDYLFTQFRAIMTYLRLLVLPIHQNIDYDYPLYTSFLNANVFVSFLVLLSLFGFGVYLYKRSRTSDPSFRIIAFGILWFFITLSMESSVIPLRVLISEYRIYLPSVGFFMAVMALLFVGLGKIQGTRARFGAMLLIGFLLLAYAGAAYARNRLWGDVVVFWRDTAQESPNKFVPYYNLAMALERRGRYDEAFQAIGTVLALKPSYADGHNELGVLYKKTNRAGEAEKAFLTAVMLKPDFDEAHRNLGVLYDDAGRFGEAVSEFQRVKKINPASDRACNDLGTAYYFLGRFDDALAEFREALVLNPANVDAYNNIGVIYDEQGLYKESIQALQAALQVSPDDKKAHENLGISYFHMRRFEEAETEFNIVVAMAPESAEARRYLGIINNERMQTRRH